MARKFPIHPAHPERICWGCDQYCPADAMKCGNGSVATLHPSELFGEDWMSWGLDAAAAAPAAVTAEGGARDAAADAVPAGAAPSLD